MPNGNRPSQGSPEGSAGEADRLTSSIQELISSTSDLEPEDRRLFEQALEFERGSEQISFSLGGPIFKTVG